MTPLPERRKTAEELAGLREALGIPDELPPGAPGAQGAAGRDRHGIPEPRAAGGPAGRKMGHRDAGSAVPGAEVPDAGAESGAPAQAKPVRSLRRSERKPAIDRPRGPVARADGKLPAYRHSDGDLQRIRMSNALQVKPPVEHIAAQAAHPALVVLGYALAVGGGIGGLLVALLVFLKKPRSSHHAAWMTIIGVLVLVFGILYLLTKEDGP